MRKVYIILLILAACIATISFANNDVRESSRCIELANDTISFYYDCIGDIYDDYIVYTDPDANMINVHIPGNIELIDRLWASHQDEQWLTLAIAYDSKGYPYLIEVDSSFYK